MTRRYRHKNVFLDNIIGSLSATSDVKDKLQRFPFNSMEGSDHLHKIIKDHCSYSCSSIHKTYLSLLVYSVINYYRYIGIDMIDETQQPTCERNDYTAMKFETI